MSNRSQRWTDLLMRAQQGERGAFAVLLDEAQPTLWARAFARLGDENLADDVATEVFVRAWNNLASFDPARANGQTWLHTILDRLVLDALDSRRRQRRREVSGLGGAPRQAEEQTGLPEPEDDVELAPPEGADRSFRKALVEEALLKLDEADRTILLLRDVEGRGHEEIARIVGCSLKAVGPRLTRARERFRQVLHPEGQP